MKKALLILALAFTTKFSFAQVFTSQTHVSICTGSSTTIGASGADSYFWSPSLGLNSTIGNSIIASPGSSTTYTVTGFDANGNSSEAFVEIQVNSNPVVNLDFIQPGSCNFINGLYVNAIYQDIKVIKDIKYGQNYIFNGQLKDLKLDIYMPNQLVNYQRPAIVVLHGGGFLFGHKEDSLVVALSQYYASRGYVVYNADYRTGMSAANALNTGKAYYRAVQDAKSCVRYIRKTGVDIGVDTSQIFMIGVSAGALTSIATAYLDQNEIPSFVNYSSLGMLENASGNEGFSSKISAVVSISGGVFDTTTIFDNEVEPIYSFHGTADSTVPYYSGLVGGLVLTYGGFSVNKAASDDGLNSTLHTFLNGGHVPALTSPQMDSVFSESNAFLYDKLKYKHGENSCAMILASGGSQYSWEPTVALSNSNSNQLIAWPSILTNYTLTVSDSNGCAEQNTIEIKNNLPLKVDIKIDTVTKFLNLKAEVSNGQISSNYLWSDASTNNQVNHVIEGNYSLTVTSGECIKTDSIQIDFPDLTKPTNLFALYINSCSAKFSWVPMAGALYQRVKLTNLVDSTVFQSVVSINKNIYEFNGLIPDNEYRFEIINYIWNDLTAGATGYGFKTGLCEIPIQFNEYNIGDTYASIQWTGACNPISYRFKYRIVGDSVWTVKSAPDENISLYNLIPGSNYEYVTRTVCVAGSKFSKKSEIGSFTTIGSKSENVSYKINNGISLFPNPSNGTFTIQATLPDKISRIEIEIINSIGQIVFKQPVKTEDGFVNEDISFEPKLSAGVYEVHLKSGNTILKSRIVLR